MAWNVDASVHNPAVWPGTERIVVRIAGAGHFAALGAILRDKA